MTPPDEHLRMHRSVPDEGAVVVGLCGELDLLGVEEAEKEIAPIEAERPPLLVLDLRELEFIDSSGLRFVMTADARARSEGRSLAVVPGTEQVRRVLHTSGLDGRLELLEDPPGSGRGQE